MAKQQKLSSNMEDYLEAIVMLEKQNSIVRVRDISKHLNVTYPSVTDALATLSANGLVKHEKYGHVELSAKGKKLAQELQRRHNMVTKFLTTILGVDNKIAEQDACKIEHVLSKETVTKLTKFMNKGKEKWCL